MPRLVSAASRLAEEVDGMDFAPPVAYVYNPLRYAWKQHEEYLRVYGSGPKRVLFLGMNPGPWGMAQTGIPFGEIALVRDWLGIAGDVSRPVPEHPKRPILGFDCQRSEVSGRRLWSLFKERHGSAADFFEHHFVSNYCPLVFMEESARNRTPDKLPQSESAPLFDACDRHLIATVEELRPDWLIGVGAFAEKRLLGVQARLNELGLQPSIARILHPSPASPAANRGWAEAATAQLLDLGVWAG